MRIRSLVMAALLAGAPVTAAAKDYAAERFDSRITVLRGGALEVTETVVFRFNGGAFTQVYRQIPGRRTDGIEIVRASMDGVPMPQGEGPGHIEISGSSGAPVALMVKDAGPWPVLVPAAIALVSTAAAICMGAYTAALERRRPPRGLLARVPATPPRRRPRSRRGAARNRAPAAVRRRARHRHRVGDVSEEPQGERAGLVPCARLGGSYES